MSIQNVKAPRGTTIIILIIIVLIILASVKLVRSVGKNFTSQADITIIPQ